MHTYAYRRQTGELLWVVGRSEKDGEAAVLATTPEGRHDGSARAFVVLARDLAPARCVSCANWRGRLIGERRRCFHHKNAHTLPNEQCGHWELHNEY